jgi:outer membrane scaffolding protein for murein synthesis (MipA/OmpV family)
MEVAAMEEFVKRCAGKRARGKASFAAVMSLALVAGAPSLIPAADAQTLQELEQQGLQEQPMSARGWNVTLGAGFAFRPDYPGASSDRVRPIPLVSIRYRDWFSLGAAGLRMNVIDRNGLRAGPVLGFAPGRSQSDDVRLNGLGDIEPSATAGIFAAYRIGRFELSGTLRQAVIHAHNGLTGLVRFEYHAALIPQRVALVIGPDLEVADTQSERTWFGVTADQSTRSGLPVYTPGAGVKDVGLHAALTYRWSEHVLLRGFASIKELVSDAADSPIVQSKTQAVIGMGVAYHF